MGLVEMIVEIGIEVLPLVKQLVQSVFAYKAGDMSLEDAKAKADAALAAMLAGVNPKADAAATNAEIDAEAKEKFGQ